MTATAECTGVAASWCPIHGDCTCPRDKDGGIVWRFEGGFVAIHGVRAWDETARAFAVCDDDCPLHGADSGHAG